MHVTLIYADTYDNETLYRFISLIDQDYWVAVTHYISVNESISALWRLTLRGFQWDGSIRGKSLELACYKPLV